jgi:hypothetical protein
VAAARVPVALLDGDADGAAEWLHAASATMAPAAAAARAKGFI